jgi:hypothetical protein
MIIDLQKKLTAGLFAPFSESECAAIEHARAARRPRL